MKVFLVGVIAAVLSVEVRTRFSPIFVSVKKTVERGVKPKTFPCETNGANELSVSVSDVQHVINK